MWLSWAIVAKRLDAVINPHELEPVDFERFVKVHLESLAASLTNFRVEHLEKFEGRDGDYEIDVTARFEALGSKFLVLVECKRYKASNPIERELIQILHQKMQSLDAQKAIMYSTSNYRSGAVEFAQSHNIALVRVEYDQIYHEVKAFVGELKPKLVSPASGSIDRYLLS